MIAQSICPESCSVFSTFLLFCANYVNTLSILIKISRSNIQYNCTVLKCKFKEFKINFLKGIYTYPLKKLRNAHEIKQWLPHKVY
jgi:hypothetical protein